MTTVFRPYSPSDALRSDRSAGDRLRHRQKVRQAIRDNIADIVSEEAIIGKSRDKIIKVPIRGIREFRFVFGDNSPGVGMGDGEAQPGQVVGQAGEPSQGPGRAGNEAGVDYYETDIELAELIDILFEDLELPDMERRKLNSSMTERLSKRKGYRRAGPRVHLDRRRTAKARIRRRVARGIHETQDEGERFPFHRDDFKFRRLTPEDRPQSNALVLCIMDTSGSMDTLKKYLARSFFFLLYQFVRSRYNNVEVVFVAHDTGAREVTEEEFFHKGQSGGTNISSGYLKALEIIQARYHPTLWNIYAFHCSDGDNFAEDNNTALNAAKQLCEVCNLFGYGEVKPKESSLYSSSMMEIFGRLEAPNFQTALIQKREEIWPTFKKLLTKDTAAQ